MLKNRSERRLIVWFMTPAVLIYGVFFVYPAIQGMLDSLFVWQGLNTNKTFVGLDNFARLWREFTDPDDFYGLRLYALHNAFILVFGILSVFIGLFVAYLINEKPFGYRMYRITFFFPNVLALPAIAMLWGLVLNPSFGLLNTLLEGIGLGQFALPWLSLQYEAPLVRLGLYVVGFIGVWGGIGWFMLVFLAAMQNVPKDYTEAAIIDGASRFRIFFSVTLPMIWETFRTVLIYTVIGSLGGFAIIYALFGGKPQKHADMILNYYYFQAFTEYNWGYAASIAAVMFVITISLTGLTYALTRRDSVAY